MSKLRLAVGFITVLAAVMVAAGWTSSQTTAVKLMITPRQVLIDQPVDVRATGLRPGEHVILQLTTKDRLGIPWRSITAMQAGATGIVDTRSSMKPFWSMKPVGHSASTTQFALSRSDMVVTARLMAAQHVLATTQVVRSTEASDLTSKNATLSADGFLGTYYARPGVQHAPAVITLDGSGGGHSELPAALLASHGYPTLSLAYFGEGALPPTLKDIPLEYFAKALTWLGKQPEVDPQRMTVLGISRGGEAALLTAANFPDLVHGVVACTSGSQVLGPGRGLGNAWTLQGKPIPLGPIPVGSITARVWTTGGGKDEVIDSAQGVRDMLAAAKANGRSNITGAIYKDAGHAVGCVIPNQPLPQQFSLGPGNGYFERGGTPAGNEAAAAASWPHIERLLQSLK